MADDHPKKGLGRGLSALLGEDRAPGAGGTRAGRDVPIEFLRPNRFQPRRHFDAADLADLAESVREHGVLQPILVRRVQAEIDAYEIIAGERRWRAAQQAQLAQVPVIVKDLNDSQALEVALVENVQRADLTPIEEAKGYERLIENFNHTQERIAQLVGRSRSHVANTLRLLALPPEVQTMLDDGRLTAGHGRALLSVDDPKATAERIIAEGLNVRAAEALVPDSKRYRQVKNQEKDPDTVALEHNLSTAVGLKVEISHCGEKGGVVRINYSSLDQLDDIYRRLIQNGPSTRFDHS
ncbi:MAG: ParB/RepB/Spo0J family partition protein [Alphaproteobacteria bacterium]|nr:ParB/RepB/Spo0J family partition protein [Alphaproteobacteria bacterium]